MIEATIWEKLVALLERGAGLVLEGADGEPVRRSETSPATYEMKEFAQMFGDKRPAMWIPRRWS